MQHHKNQAELNTSVPAISLQTDPQQSPIFGCAVPAANSLQASKSGYVHITNAEFVTTVFQGLPDAAFAAVCTKAGDPTEGGWQAIRADAGAAQLSEKNNNYVNCASFYLDTDESIKARKSNSAACHFIMLDDIGTKVPLNRFDDFKLSWLIETSPGNHQAGIILNHPLTNSDLATRLLDSIISAGLCDSGASGPLTRWTRLPFGINGKPQHKSDAGDPFQCRLVQWNPDSRYTVSQIVSGLKLRLPAPRIENSKADTPESGFAAANGTSNDENSIADQPTGAINIDGTLEKIAKLLNHIDADCGYIDWLHALMAVFHETGGSDAGLALTDRWSSTGSKYVGCKEIELKWKSFRNGTPNPVTIGTLIKMAGDSGANIAAIMQNDDDCFEPCETEVVEMQVPTQIKTITDDTLNNHPLGKYSLRGRSAEVAKQVSDQIFVLGELALQGQATVLYAAPNTGKTLLTLHLLTQSIKQRRIDPSKVYYVNVDDTASGLLTKLEHAEEYGFHMLAEGYQNFKASKLLSIITNLTETDQARGVIIILDTLKKFTDLMDKKASSHLTGIIRAFTLKGGTTIALAHTNKKPGSDGKRIYAGTSDIMDDFDCGYTLDIGPRQAETGHQVVEFTNAKRRGDVAYSAAYSYATERGLPYAEVLLSVQEINAEQLLPIKQAAELQSDVNVIAAIESCISGGTDTKMKIVDAAAKQSAVSQRTVLKILDKYTGESPASHRWKYLVAGRGAKVYKLLERPAANPIELAKMLPSTN